MTGRFWYDMDKAGVAEILKSEPVKALLKAEADKKLSEANRLLRIHYPKGASDPGYEAEVLDLTFTSVGQVRQGSRLSIKDNKTHRTLDAINH